MKKTKLLTLLASMFLLAGCGTSEPEKEPVEIYEVKVNPTAVELTVGEGSKKVNYNVFGKGEFSKEVEISSLDESIATVAKAEEGMSFAISPVKEGETVVTVKSKADETKVANVSVKVNPEKIIVVTPEVTAVKVSQKGFELAIGSAPQSVQVTVEGKGEYDKGVDVLSANPEIVAVSKNELVSGESFLVSALSKGNTDIQVTSKSDKTKGAIVSVLVTDGGVKPEPVDITLDPMAKELVIGDKFNVTTTVKGTTSPVSYSVEGTEGVIALSNESDTGVTVEGLHVGEAILRASVENRSATCRILVTEPDFYTGIQVKLNDGEAIDLVKSAYDPTKEYLAQYTYTFDSIEEGTRVDFYGKLSDVYNLISENIGPSPDDYGNLVQNNLKPATESDIDWTVLKDGENVTLYFEIYEEGSSFWLTGGPEIETPKAHLLGIGGDWTSGLLMSENTEKAGEYYIHDVAISKTDEFKVNLEDNWAGFANVKDGCASLVKESASDGNIMVKKAGTYNIYWDSNETGEPAKSIWIELVEEEPVTYTVKLNDGEAITLGLDDADKPEAALHQYSTNATLSKDDVITFYADGELITSIGVDRDSEGQIVLGNNVLESEGNFVIHNDYTPEEGHKSIYLKEYEDGYSIWGSGYVAPTPVDPVYTLKLNGGEDITLSVDDAEKPYGTLHQYSTNVSVSKNDVLSFYKDGTLISSIGVDRDSEGQVVSGNNVLESDGKFLIHNDYAPEEGHKSIYLKEYEDGYSIWGSGYEAPTPVDPVYTLKLNDGEDITLALDDASKPEGVIHQYSTIVEVSKGEVLTFYKDGTLISSIGVDRDSEGQVVNGNNVIELSGSFLIHNDYAPEEGHKSIYLKEYESGFSIWGSGYKEEPKPVLTGYAIKVGETYFNLDAVTPTPEGLDAQYIYEFASIEEGTRVDFYANYDEGNYVLLSTNISPNPAGDHKNNLAPATTSGTDWTVIKDASDASLYFEIKGESFGFWLEGGPEVLTGFYLSINDNLVKLDEADPFEEYTQYVAKEIDLKAGDIVKIYDASTEKTFCPTLQEGGASSKFDTSTEEQLSVVSDGNYDFYLKLKYGADLIYISENVAPVTYTAKLNGGEAITLDLDETSKPEGAVHQYSTDVKLHENDVITFYADGELIASVHADEDGEKKNNIRESSSVLTVHNDHAPEEGHKSIYLKEYESGFSVWGQGYKEPVAKSIEFEVAEKDITVSEVSVEVAVIATNVSDIAYSTEQTDVVSIESSDDTKISIRGLKSGDATIVASAEEGTVTANLIVHVSEHPVEDVRTYYMTNSKYWENPHVYVYGDGAITPKAWPGNEMTFDHKNGDGQDVYKFDVDVNLYHTFIFNNGSDKQTCNVNYNDFTTNNACWVKDDKDADGKYLVGYWNYIDPEIVKSISFDASEITVGTNESPLGLNVTAKNVSEITYTSSDETLATVSELSTDNQLVLNLLKEGTVSIVASAEEGTVTSTLTVHIHNHVFDSETHLCTCGAAEEGYTAVTFKVKSNTYEGQDLFLVGDFTTPTWKEGKIAMHYVSGEDNPWQVTVAIATGTKIAYKILMIDGYGDHWMSGDNKTLDIEGVKLTKSFEYNFN